MGREDSGAAVPLWERGLPGLPWELEPGLPLSGSNRLFSGPVLPWGPGDLPVPSEEGRPPGRRLARRQGELVFLSPLARRREEPVFLLPLAHRPEEWAFP